MKNCISLLLFFFFFGSLNAQTIPGTWQGNINIQGQELGIILNIEGEPGNYSGTLDIPAQGARDLPLIYVVVNGDSLTAAFNAGQNVGEFAGVIHEENRINGNYTQGAASFPFELQRQGQSSARTTDAGTGDGQDLVIQNGNMEIAGTLVLPEWPSQPPLVILLSGSGAQNRDSEVGGFKIFAQMAEFLKSQNIASFRYDDREVGGSTGTFSDAGLNILASDVHAIIRYFENSESTNFGDIILLGHSQGGIVAGKVASENAQVDQLILMASPSVTMEEILRYQVQEAYEEINLQDDVIEQEISARENLMEAITKDEGIERAKEEYKNEYQVILESLSEEQKAALPGDRESFMDRQANQLVSFYSSPQMQSLLFHDPTDNLEELEIPVLVLYGEKDTQVDPTQNRQPIERALEQAGVEFEINTIEDANHIFQKAETGEVSEYTSLEKDFIKGFLSTISGWIKSH